MRSTIRSITKSCRSCQLNKKRKLKYGHLSSKIVITIPWQALCVDLIGPYTLKGKDGSVIDFMALRMIDPATSWFEVVELPFRRLKTVTVDGKERTPDIVCRNVPGIPGRKMCRQFIFFSSRVDYQEILPAKAFPISTRVAPFLVDT
jgi:hypothetical protein